MNRKSYAKKAISVVLAALMCLSVCVLDWSVLFPKAEAATAGQYYVYVDGDCGNGASHSNEEFRVYYKPNNGTGTETSTVLSRISGNWTDDSGDPRYGAWINGFPTKFTLGMKIDGGLRQIEYSIKVSVYNTATQNCDSNVILSTGKYEHASDLTESKSFTDTHTVPSDKYPKATSISWSTSAASGTVPTSGTNTVGSGTATVKDQYGVNWYQAPYFSIHTDNTAYTANKTVANGIALSTTSACDSCNVNITNAAKDWVSNNSDGTTYQRSFYMNAYFGTLKTGNKAITLTNCKYSLDLNGYVSPSYPTNYTSSGNISGYGTADVSNRGSVVSNDCTDYYTELYYGTSYSISDIKANTGYVYEGVYSGSTSGKIAGATSVALKYRIANSKLTVKPNSGTWGDTTSDTTKQQAYNSTLSVPVPTKSGWTFTGWTKSSTFYGTLSSTTAAGTYTFPSNDGVTSTITAGWKRGITNTYHWLKADATTDQTATASGTAYDTATTLALTAPAASLIPATVAKDDKTWTFKGWKEGSATTWGGATATAEVTAGASHNVATTSSAHTFYPVYALTTTKFYANYNYYTDNAAAYSKITKNTTVNGDANTGTMAVATVSDTGAGAEIARYYNKNGRIYELQGWATTEGATTATIPYNAATATLNVPGAGTPASNANTTPIELYPVYTLYGTAITARYYYWNADGTNEEYREASGMAIGSATAGTLTMPGADQVISSYTKDGVTYTLKGWTKVSNADTNYIAFGGTQSASVLANPATDYYTFYPVYECTTKAQYNFFSSTGAQANLVKSTTLKKTDASTPTTADVDVAQTSEFNQSFTLDDRIFTFCGWRNDKTSAAPAIGTLVASENHPITNTAYQYYAIYKNDELALSYNTTHDGITAVPTPETQEQTQYINAGLASSTDNASPFTFTVGPDGLVPVKKGYTFIGWGTTDSEDETFEKANSDTIAIKLNTTLYARFNVNEQNVSFVYYDGSNLEGGYTTVTKKVSYDDLKRDDTNTKQRYVVTAPTVKKIGTDNIVSSDIIVHANDKYHYVFKEWVRSDGKGIHTTSGNYTAYFKNVTEDITVQATYDAYAHHYVDLTTAELNALGIEGTASKDATCTTDGYQYKQCADCGHIYKEILAKLNHKDENGNDVKKYSGYKAPGCETTGKYATAACALCGDTVKVDGNVQYYDIVDNAFVAIDSDDGIIPATGHDFELTKTVAPTCTERGYDLWVCANNELHTEKRDYVTATGHTEATVEAVAPTCTTDGKTEKIYCSVCNCIVVDSYIVPALGHTLVKTAAKAASCTEEGNIEYYTCSVCNKIYSDKYAAHEITAEDTVTAALGHDYVETPAEAATCTKAGHTGGIVCSRCGEPAEGSSAVTTQTALGHDLDDGDHTGSLLPCKEPGYTTYSCSRCDYTEIVYDELAAHTEKTVDEVPATCTAMGKTAYTVCEVCGEPLTSFKWIPVKAHEYTITVSDEVPATCTEAGVSAVLECECGATIGGEEIPALCHSFTGWVVVEAATCTEGGRKERYCKVCGETETEAIAAAGHIVVDVAEVDATCAAEGCTAGKKCSVCGEITEGCEVIPMLEHTMGDPEIIREATCALEGLKVTKCEDCEYQIVEPIAKIAHTEKMTKEAVAATCEASGKTAEIICEACGEVLQAQKTVAKLEHSYVTVAAVAPTCTENGLSSYQKCEDCNFELTSAYVIPATGHIWGDWQLVKAPTCTKEGSRERVCTVEGCTEKETKDLEALGHNVTKTEAKANTCGKAGNVEYYTCSRCEGKFFADEACTVEIAQADTVLAALEHSWGSPDVVLPNCTEKGYTLETCGNCGKTRTINETEAQGHVGGTATCTQKAVCEVCDVAYGGFAAHNYVSEYEQGTCVKCGFKTDTCTVCGKTVTVPTGFGDHETEFVVIKDSTCTEEGTYQFVCVHCTEVIETGVIPADGHSDEDGDGKCDACGVNVSGEGTGEGEGSGTHTGNSCDKCGKDHGGKQGGLFGYNGFICKLLAFFNKIISFFKG